MALTLVKSEPFFKSFAVGFTPNYVAPNGTCGLCAYEHAHPGPADQITSDDNKFGLLWNLNDDICLCGEASMSEMHRFHLKCIRAFVLGNKAVYRGEDPGCPVCDDLIVPGSADAAKPAAPVVTETKAPAAAAAAASGDDDGEVQFGAADAGEEKLFGKKRKRDKENYTCWVHIIQATGLKLKKTDKHMNPICVVNAFGQTLKTPLGDKGKTYSCVWNFPMTFQKVMDIEEFSKETITIRVEDERLLKNELIGSVKYQAQKVNQNGADKEFYRQWINIVQVSKDKSVKAIGMQGKLQVSICIVSETDMKNNPKLPTHIYDLEVQMWADLDQKKAVVDYNISGNYLSQKMDEKKASDALLTSDFWDIMKIKCYRAELLPKVSSSIIPGGGWCDGYLELGYEGLLDKSKPLRTPVVKKTAEPVWNHEFEIPIPSGIPVMYNRVDVKVMDHNPLSKDVEIGRCFINITDIQSADKGTLFWKNLYQDIDGQAPTYRGRVLMELGMEEETKDARMSSKQCTPATSLPPSQSYRIDVDVLEGTYLEGGHSEYQVDVTLGHSMLHGDLPRERCGFLWETFNSTRERKSGDPSVPIPFLQSRTLLVNNLPAPRVAPPSSPRPVAALPAPAAAKRGDEKTADVPDQKREVSPPVVEEKRPSFTTDTVRMDYLAQWPDMIVYVSKKGARDKCVGYLRIPVDGVKRPTENWEHGEDLTVFPDLWDAKANTGRCLGLKPLKELYAALTGFLTLRLRITPVNATEAKLIQMPPPTVALPAIRRQKYKFVANIYQAKEMASVDSSGLSNPQAYVQLMGIDMKTSFKMQTCYPLWFEALETMIELPENLHYAPDITVTLYHYKEGSFFKWRDPSIFMGKAEIPAITATPTMGSPEWYPLAFEEHTFGEVLLAFRLTPEKDLGTLDIVTKDLTRMVGDWQEYNVEVSALDMRGSMATKFAKTKKDPVYQLECWGAIQSFTQSMARSSQLTVKIKKPENPIFYSSINIRVYESMDGKDPINLQSVASIGIDQILRTNWGWYKILDVFARDPKRLAKKYVRLWRAFLRKRGIKVTETAIADATPSKLHIHKGPNRFAYLKDGDPSETKVEVAPGSLALTQELRVDVKNLSEIKIDVGDSSSPSPTSTQPIAPAGHEVKSKDVVKFAAREVDAEGKEKIDPKHMKRLQCPQVDDVDAGDPWERHWKLECEYEMLPLIQDPFTEVSMKTGKDECHQTFLEKLFVQSKHSVGTIRGNFFAYRSGASAVRGEKERLQSQNNVFDLEKYKTVARYVARVYILRGLQLSTKKGVASACDPIVTISIGGQKQKSKLKEGTMNPQFYEYFDFNIPLPAVESTLTVSVSNDSGGLLGSGELIGSTDIALENRLYARQWQNSRRPTERRALFVNKKGRMPQGFIEVCLDIFPEADVAKTPYHYLLTPPVRTSWELRVVLYNTRKVTPKKIYKTEDTCCLMDLCLPPNQSDIKLICGISGPDGTPAATDVHLRSVDGEGNFNWRTIHEIKLPAPEPLCNLKVQVWNINWNPDDCIAEAIIPLWGFFEFARRTYNADKENKEKWIARIPKQWVHMTHPHSTDQGDVEMAVELLPKTIAVTPEYMASAGEDGWVAAKNAEPFLLKKHKRPATSFPWWRLDLQILYRVKYCLKRSRWCLLTTLLIFIGLIVLWLYL